MSHTFEGRYYRTTAEYEAAVRDRDLRVAREEADTLRRQTEVHRRRMREVEEELADAQEDLARQQRLQEELRGHVSDLRQTQHLLQQALARHAEQVREEFANVRIELEQEVAAAERRQAEVVAAVNAKVEADRRERALQAQNDADRAAAYVRFARAMLDGLSTRIDPLALQAEDSRARTRLTFAERELADPTANRSAALTVALEAYASAGDLERETDRRTAELSAAGRRLKATAQRLRSLLPTGARAAELFTAEIRAAEVKLTDLEQRAERNYQRYAELEVNRKPDEAAAAELERELMLMAALAPVMTEWHRQRIQRLGEIQAGLVRALDHIGENSPHTYEVESDRKSDLKVTFDAGGARVQVRLPLRPDDPIQLDGYGHESNAQCQAQAERVSRALAERLLGGGTQQLDGHARATPQQPKRAEPAPWVGMVERIRKIGGES